MEREGKGGRGGLVDTEVGSSLLLLGEFQSVAEDLDSLLLMTGSTCLGKLTVEAEHLPAPERTQHTTTVHKAAGGRLGRPVLDSLNTKSSLFGGGGETGGTLMKVWEGSDVFRNTKSGIEHDACMRLLCQSWFVKGSLSHLTANSSQQLQHS